MSVYYVVKQYYAHMLCKCVILQYFAYFNYTVLSLERIAECAIADVGGCVGCQFRPQ